MKAITVGYAVQKFTMNLYECKMLFLLSKQFKQPGQ